METVYLICAIVGGTVVACQFLLTLFGLGGGHDGMDGGGHGFDVHHDGPGAEAGGHGGESNWLFGTLSLRALSASLAFFGLAGLAASKQLDDAPAAAVAVVAGLSALFLVGWLLRQMLKLNVDGTVHIDRAVGQRGTVYLTIPGGRAGAGKVHVSVLNRTLEYKAITAHDPLATGTPIEVVGVVAPDTVEVTPVSSAPEDPAHG
jgi:hypothetical protein